jgi:trehalose 6-phosphate phosphatase
VRALSADPPGTALCTDFDGTLAPIVADPARSRPVPGVPALLGRLADRMSAVAVVSGRPGAFLAAALAGAGPRVQLVGLYGLEWVEDGTVRLAPEAVGWVGPATAAAAAARADAERPDAVEVEPKGPSVTLHWRRSPGGEAWALGFARAWAGRTGLVAQPGRMSVELRPPLEIDKGTVVERLGRGRRLACFAGDDAGDLAAFAALDRLAASGTAVQRVAVADAESPPELVRAADVVVRGGPVRFATLLGQVDVATA